MYIRNELLNSDMLFFSGVGLILNWSWSWTENCLQLNDDLSKICLWIINHFTWNDRWSISRFWSWIVHHPTQTFQAKSCVSWRFFFTMIDRRQNIFCYRQWKRNCWSLKIFFINQYDFCKKSKNCHFPEKWQILGGGVFYPKIWLKMGGSALPFGGQQYYGKSGTSGETPPPKLQNWHGNKLEKRTWLGTTMRGFQWQTSYTNY